MKPSEEIRRIVERWMQAISERDSESSLERVSDLPGALMIGTDPEEWFHGAEARAIWARQLEELDSFSVVGTEIEAWEEGTVGWASVKEKISWDEQEAEGRPFSSRWTRATLRCRTHRSARIAGGCRRGGHLRCGCRQMHCRLAAEFRQESVEGGREELGVARGAGSFTVTRSPPAARGVRVSVPSCAWVMLLTIARPRPTPALSVRMRLVPRETARQAWKPAVG